MRDESRWIFDLFILDRIDRELPSLERLELKFGLSSEFFNKTPVRILLDVLFPVFRFSKASFYAFYEIYAILTAPVNVSFFYVVLLK